MPEFLASGGTELPFILILIALLGFRWTVSPRASLYIDAPMKRVFDLLDFREGDEQRWQRTRVNCKLIKAATQTYRLTFVTPLATGATQSSQADFRIAARDEPRFIDIERAGLEGRSKNSELLKMEVRLNPEGRGTRLDLTYHWGPRPLLAQLMARTDLWGSVYRLKGMAETGVPDYRTDGLIAVGVAVVTGVVSLATFALVFGWLIAPLLVACLLVHEFGHLLAYRMIGQPWGRLIFLPFLGAVAMPRLAFTTQSQSVFSALMGPAISVVIPLAAAIYVWAGWPHPELPILAGIVASALNLFNLLPVEPLDGGVVLRSLLARLMGAWARFGMIALGVAIAAAGWSLEQVLLVIFGGLAIAVNIRPRMIDPGLVPMPSLQVTISGFGFMAVVAAYAGLLRYLLGAVPGGT